MTNDTTIIIISLNNVIGMSLMEQNDSLKHSITRWEQTIQCGVQTLQNQQLKHG